MKRQRSGEHAELDTEHIFGFTEGAYTARRANRKSRIPPSSASASRGRIASSRMRPRSGTSSLATFVSPLERLSRAMRLRRGLDRRSARIRLRGSDRRSPLATSTAEQRRAPRSHSFFLAAMEPYQRRHRRGGGYLFRSGGDIGCCGHRSGQVLRWVQPYLRTGHNPRS